MRLIDADELKKSYKQRYKESLIDRNRGIDLSEYAEMACDKFDEFVDSIPDAGKTGHWIMPQQDDGMSDPIYYQVRCSECGFDLDPQTWYEELKQYGADKYCPKCGAKLVEDKPKRTLLDNVAEWDKAIEKRGYIE